jgi:PKD repeat protein
MKQWHRLLLSGSIFVILCGILNAQNGPPWIKTNVGFNYIFKAIDFPGNQDMTGFMAGESLTYNGDGIVLKTTDGGSTWVSKWTGANMGLEGACFVDENTGFVVGWPQLANGWSGFGRTTDGGNTWTSPAVIPDVYYFTDVVFKDANNGVIFGASNTSPVVRYTSNGGNTWTAATGINNNMPYHACYVSGSTYFMVDNSGHISKSVNDGHSWTTVYTVPGGLLTGIDFFSDNVGMACGDNGLIVKTNDGGVSWQVQQVGTDIWHDLGWQNETHVFCCGTPEIVAESLNGGNTWGNGFPASTYQAALYECVFTPNGSGFICGSQGTLLTREPACTAAFTAGTTGICSGSSVSFSDQSSGDIVSWEWTFEGGAPATSNLQNPVVTYNLEGTFDVKLIVSNGIWSDTMAVPDYITVTQKATPVISSVLYTLTSNVPSGNQWYRDGFMLAGATGPSLAVSQTGDYWDVVTLNGCVSDTSNHIYIVFAGVPPSDEELIKVWQIPGTTRIRFESSVMEMETFDISILNTPGLKIFERKAIDIPPAGFTEIDHGPVSPGIYFIVLSNSHGRVVRKIYFGG